MVAVIQRSALLKSQVLTMTHGALVFNRKACRIEGKTKLSRWGKKPRVQRVRFASKVKVVELDIMDLNEEAFIIVVNKTTQKTKAFDGICKSWEAVEQIMDILVEKKSLTNDEIRSVMSSSLYEPVRANLMFMVDTLLRNDEVTILPSGKVFKYDTFFDITLAICDIREVVGPFTCRS